MTLGTQSYCMEYNVYNPRIVRSDLPFAQLQSFLEADDNVLFTFNYVLK